MRAPFRRLGLSRSASFEPLERRCLLASLDLELSERPIDADQVLSAAFTPSVSNRFGSGIGLEGVRRTYGLTGQGQTVAVIDTGIAYDQTALGGGFGESARVVGGWDVAERDPNPYDDGPAGFHGTHVAGIIASQNDRYPGIAPDVDLVAVRVFDDLGRGNLDWVEEALVWVDQHRNDFRYPITTVNLSLGSAHYGTSPPIWANLEEELRQLNEHGILVVAAAGNSFSINAGAGLSYPAASPFVLPVGSLGSLGAMSDFSQRSARIIAAPGEAIVSSVPDHLFSRDQVHDDWATASGTSMSSPVVAGASVLVRQAIEAYGLPAPTPTELVSILRQSASKVFDPHTGRTYAGLQLPAALRLVMPVDKYGDELENAEAWGLLDATQSVSGIIQTRQDVDGFKFEVPSDGVIEYRAEGIQDLNLNVSLENARIFLEEGKSKFEVLAGKQYYLRIGSDNGIGRYSLDVGFTPSVVDWGVIESARLDIDISSNGIARHAMTAAHNGILTLAGDSQDHWRVVRANGDSAFSNADENGNQRVDLQVTKGERLFVDFDRASDFELKVINRVQVADRNVVVHGANQADATTIGLGTRTHLVIDGVRYAWYSSQIDRVSVHGFSDRDSLKIYGSRASEALMSQAATTQVSGNGPTITVEGIEQIRMISGGGLDDVARFSGTRLNDRFDATPYQATMKADRFTVTVEGFDRVYADGLGGSHDVARLFGSHSNDQLLATEHSVRLFGDGFHVCVKNMEQVSVDARTGDDDVARFFGTSSADQFIGRVGDARLTFDSMIQIASGFDRVYVVGLDGPGDHAELRGGALNDRFRLDGDQVIHQSHGYYQKLTQWRQLEIDGNGGEDDVTYLSGTDGDDILHVRGDQIRFQTPGRMAEFTDFDRFYAEAVEGGNDQAYIWQRPGVDRMGSSLKRDWVYLGNQFRAATGFDHVIRFDDVDGFREFAPANNGAADASRDLIEKLDRRLIGPLMDQPQSDSLKDQSDILCQNRSLEVNWSARVDQVLDRLSDLLQEDELEWGIGPERPHANVAI